MKVRNSFLPILTAIMMLVVSCSDDSDIFSPNDVSYENNGGNSNGGNSGGGGNTTDPVADNVRNYVTTQFTYNNARLYYDVTITSSLESIYPNKNITYGVEYGYDNTYCYYKTRKKQSGTVKFIIPVGNVFPTTGSMGFAFWQYEGWQFSVWNWVEQYGAGTYPSSYYTINDHIHFMSSLGAIYNVLYRHYEQGDVWESDNSLYQTAWNNIKADYNNVKNRLCGHAFVLVDGTKYVIE